MFGNEGVETVLASADGGDVDAFSDQSVCHGLSYARRCSNEEDVFVWKRHGGGIRCRTGPLSNVVIDHWSC